MTQPTPTPTRSPRPDRPTRSGRRYVLLGMVPAVGLLGLAYWAGRSGDDDDPDRRQPSERDRSAATVPGADGDAPTAPDLSRELVTTVSEDGSFELTVNEIRQDGDQVTVWFTLTNVGDDRETIAGGRLADPTLGEIDQADRADVSGAYLVDWEARKAYYPMSTDGDACLCSKGPFSFEPGTSLALFAVYNGVGELQDGSLVAPGFLPADGLAGS